MQQSTRIHIPFNFHRRGGKKMILAADGKPATPTPVAHHDNSLIRALVKAYRWQKIVESGDYITLNTLGDQENINKSYLSRILRLNLLAPDIKQAILDGTLPLHLSLKDFMKPFPLLWHEQRICFDLKTENS